MTDTTVRTCANPPLFELDRLRSIWGDPSQKSYTPPQQQQQQQQQVEPGPQLRRSSNPSLFSKHLGQLVDYNADLSVPASRTSTASFSATCGGPPLDCRNPEPIGRKTSEVFDGGYDTGSGCYSLLGSRTSRRYSLFEPPKPPVFTPTTKSFVGQSRRSSSSAIWDDYSWDGSSPPLQPGYVPTPAKEPEPYRSARHPFDDSTFSFSGALNNLNQQSQKFKQQNQSEREERGREIGREKFYRIFSMLMNGSEHQTTLPNETMGPGTTTTAKELLKAEFDALAYQRRDSQVDLLLPKPRQQRNSVIGELNSKIALSSSSTVGDADSTPLIQKLNTLVQPSSAYEEALAAIECEAKNRRTSACQTDATFKWEGTLRPRFHESPTYASKVFVGGLPYDVTPEMLGETFGKFGLTSVQLPPKGRGHAYLVFENELQVQALLDACESKGQGQFYYWVSSRRGKDRKAQIIPWDTENSDWLAATDSGLSNSFATTSLSGSSSSGSDASSTDSSESLHGDDEDSDRSHSHQSSTPPKRYPALNGPKQNTVFVGALHGEITAEGLQTILSETFGPIIHVGIDADKNRYPNGSARVTFAHASDFRRAVLAEFVHVITPRFSKTIQLDAYIEDGNCSACKMSTPVFCRHPGCFKYYCALCFEEHRRNSCDYHPPVMRNRNNGHTSSNTTSNHGGLSVNNMNVYNTSANGQNKPFNGGCRGRHLF